MINSIINAIATTAMVVILGRQLRNKVYRTNFLSSIIATLAFIMNFLIASILGNHNNVLDYYSYLQLSLVVSQLVYYNLV